MKSLFFQSALVFPQFWVFDTTFEASGQNLPILKNSVCAFYCTQNDRLHPTILMQKSVWKMDHLGQIYLEKCFQTWHAKPNCNPILFFTQISQPRVVRFSNRFLRWNRGTKAVVLSTIKGMNGVSKNQKILPVSLKNGLKNLKLREN